MDDLKLYASNQKLLESLIQSVRVFSNDMGMEFGVEKCAVLTMKKGKMANNNERTERGWQLQVFSSNTGR